MDRRVERRAIAVALQNTRLCRASPSPSVPKGHCPVLTCLCVRPRNRRKKSVALPLTSLRRSSRRTRSCRWYKTPRVSTIPRILEKARQPTRDQLSKGRQINVAAAILPRVRQNTSLLLPETPSLNQDMFPVLRRRVEKTRSKTALKSVCSWNEQSGMR